MATDIVLPEGKYAGYKLTEIYPDDPEYLRQLAWGPVPDEPLAQFIRETAAAFLAARDETPPSPTAPVDPDPQGRRLLSLSSDNFTLHVEWIGEDAIRWLLQSENEAADCYLPLLDARVLVADLAAGHLDDLFTWYGGRYDADDQPESVALVARDRGDNLRYPILIEIRNGPGKEAGEGIRPQGEPSAELSLALSRYEARRLGLALQDLFLAALLQDGK